MMKVALLGQSYPRYRYGYSPQSLNAYFRGEAEQPAKSIERQTWEQNQARAWVDMILDKGLAFYKAKVDSGQVDPEVDKKVMEEYESLSWFEKNQNWLIAGGVILAVGVLAAAAVGTRRRRR